MSHTTLEPEQLATLRGRAAARLTGEAARKGPPARMADALSALHTLASCPRTASDALALLHELQVHQVELDIQSEELQESRADLESALRHQMELYESQPVGCYTIDDRLVVHELNQQGARLLGIEREDAYGVNLGAFFLDDSRLVLQQLFSTLEEARPSTSCRLRLVPRGLSARPVRAHVRARPDFQRYYVVLTPDGDEQDPRPGQ
jgi:PAS domain-containing protein